MEKYDRNKPYNNLPLIPPDENKIITISILKALNEANKALAELKGIAKKLPNQSMLVNTISLREAKASNEIENIFTTDDELYKSLTVKKTELKGGAKEVLFYRQALWSGYNEIKKQKEFDLDLIIKIYQKIIQVNDSIRPPQTETVIMKRGSGLLGDSVVYTPPKGIGIIKQKLDNLFEFINNDEDYPYDSLIKLAIFHYQFEAIHPFRDGNGRTGRILSILIMIQKQLLEVPILYLSAYIIREKEDYYYLLNRITTTDNWEKWIIYILKAIEETSIYTIKKIEEIDRLFENTHNLIIKKLPNIRKETIEKIFEQPYISPKKLIDNNVKSLNTAKKYLRQMTELGIMIPKKIGKETIFLNIDLYNLLSEI
ncbi:MAG: Fic/DOC family N-terminal domain-containing protein [Bacteroidota bacterium]|nr:Fic/DOC family N-terminal domain-containing protein [Bacteroidota bacterium]